jgi:rubrerythrin
MDFTKPFQQSSATASLSPTELLRALRLDLAAELDAMSLYQAHIESISSPHVQAVLARIRDDEKEHAAQLLTIINGMDMTQADKLQTAQEDIQAVGQPLLRYPSIAERIRDLDDLVIAFSHRMTG